MVQPPPYGQPYGGWPDPYYAPMAPKPGCIPLRPLGVGDILGGAFSAITRNLKTILVLAVGIAVVEAVISTLIRASAISGVGKAVDNSDPSNPVIHWGRLGRVIGVSLGGSLISAVFAVVLTGMLVVVVTEDVVGRTASLSLVWTKVRSRLVRLIVLSLIVTVVSAIALLFLVVPGVWLWAIWAVAVPALVIENHGIDGALFRSYQLVRGMFWRVLGIRLLGYVISAVATGLVGLVFGAIANAVTSAPVDNSLFGSDNSVSLPAGYLIVLGIGTVVSVVISAPIQAAVDSLLYIDLRMRKEGLAADLQLAASGMQRPPAYPPQQYPPQRGPERRH